MRFKIYIQKPNLLLFLFVVMLSISLNSQNLDKHQWKHRVLLLFAQDSEVEKYKAQLEAFDSNKEAFKDRKLIIYAILPEHFRGSEQTDDTWIKGSKLYSKYNSKKLPFKIILIGLDGGVKLEQTEVLSPQKLFETIDAMPMRRSELKNRP
jgi:hypothetical protein